MKTIRTKILLCMSLTIAISLSILGIASICLNYNSNLKTLTKLMTETANISAQHVSKELLLNVVQTNSATSQQIASSSQELSSQAQLLKELAGSFHLKKSDEIGN